MSKGEWIVVRQVFITRLREQRYPTRRELDEAAPDNPVVFSTGPDASLNTLALKRSGIDKDFKVRDGGPGYIEKDEHGEPTGILRSCTRYVKSQPSGRQPTDLDRTERLLQLFKDYASVGLTTIGDRDASPSDIKRYRKLRDNNKLILRVAVSHHIGTIGAIDKIQQNIRRVAEDPLVKGDDHLRIVGIKTYLDGGMLTGSAYMRRPWGVSKIYSINDPDYRGVLFIPKERLLPIVQTTIESGLQFTAHSVGDGAVHTLLDVYEELSRKMPIRKVRPCITHCNFMSAEAVRKMAELGVVADIQPAWLYLDTRTLTAQFGYDRLRYFQPLQQSVRGRRHRRRRLRSHAEDRLAAFGQSLQSLPGHVDDDHAQGEMVRGPAASGGSPQPRAGDAFLHRQQRLHPLPRRARRLAGSGQAGRSHRARSRFADVSRG